jgi:hypothetical protein
MYFRRSAYFRKQLNLLSHEKQFEVAPITGMERHYEKSKYENAKGIAMEPS